MKNKKWDKGELNRLYNIEGKTLQEIGDMRGVSRERVRQVMEKLGLIRGYNLSSAGRNGRLGYKSLEDYFENPKERKDIDTQTLRRFLGRITCNECGKARNIHIHHIVYPATSMNDLQILCSSCHSMKHRGNMTYLKQIDIYNQYIGGTTTLVLAEKYSVSRILIYKIIRKIRNGNASIRGENHLGRLSRQPRNVLTR